MSSIPTNGSLDRAFLRNLFVLKLYYMLLQKCISTIANSIAGSDTYANDKYLELCLKIERILDDSGFDMLRKNYERPFENILSDDLSIEWQNGRRQFCNDFQSKISEEYIKYGKQEFDLAPTEKNIFDEIANFLSDHARHERILASLILKDHDKETKSHQSTSYPPQDNGAQYANNTKEKTYDVEKEYDLYKDLKNIFTNAKRNVFVVDAYIDTTVYDLYIDKIPPITKIRILTNRPPSSVIEVGRKIAKTRSLEIATSNSVHDRYIFVDGKGWMLGSSLKDAAKSKPTTLIQLQDAYKETFGLYETMWETGNKII